MPAHLPEFPGRKITDYELPKLFGGKNGITDIGGVPGDCG
jgi:hypothetical protein